MFRGAAAAPISARRNHPSHHPSSRGAAMASTLASSRAAAFSGGAVYRPPAARRPAAAVATTCTGPSEDVGDVQRRALLAAAGLALAAGLGGGAPPTARAATKPAVPVGKLYPPLPGVEGFVRYEPTSRTTPSIRAGVIKPEPALYSFGIPAPWSEGCAPRRARGGALPPHDACSLTRSLARGRLQGNPQHFVRQLLFPTLRRALGGGTVPERRRGQGHAVGAWTRWVQETATQAASSTPGGGGAAPPTTSTAHPRAGDGAVSAGVKERRHAGRLRQPRRGGGQGGGIHHGQH